MSFTQTLSNATRAITSTVTSGDDTTTEAANANEATGDKATLKAKPRKPAPAPPKDGAETITGDGDLPTKDTQQTPSKAATIGKAVADRAMERTLTNNHAARQHQRHDVEGPLEIVRGVHEAEELIHFASDVTHSGPSGVGTAVNVLSLGLSGSKIVDDVMDANGLSGDSVKPAVDIAVTVTTMVAKNNPVVKAFALGYTAGNILDHYTGASTFVADLAEPAIAQTSQIGFLTDRANENDLTVAYRTRSGTWTERDIVRSRSIVREAREHGLIDEDGSVSRYRLQRMMPNGGSDEAVERVAGGIERAVQLQNTAKDRYY